MKASTKKFWIKVGWIALLVVWVFVAVVASEFVVGFLMGLVLGDKINTPVWNGIYSVLSYAAALALIILVTPRASAKWRVEKEGKIVATGERMAAKTSREQLGLKDWPTWMDIGLSPVGYVVATLAAAGLTAIFSLIPWFNASEAQVTGFTPFMSGGEKLIAFIVLVVLAPVVEEVIFRGFLYGKLRTRLNAPVAIIVVSLLFGLMHFQWNVAVDVFALSVVVCVLREITGTVYAGILTHMIKNGVAFYLLYVIGFG